MVTVKQIRNWHACKSVLHSIVRSPCVPCRIPETVFNHHSLQIFQPVRKTVLHKSDFSFLSSCTFCPYCIKLISRNKSCLPVTQSIRVNSWTVSCGGKNDCRPPVWQRVWTCNLARFRAASAARDGGVFTAAKAGSKESEQPWPRKFRPGCTIYREIFLREESHFRVAERSVVNLKKFFLVCSFGLGWTVYPMS